MLEKSVKQWLVKLTCLAQNGGSDIGNETFGIETQWLYVTVYESPTVLRQPAEIL